MPFKSGQLSQEPHMGGEGERHPHTDKTVERQRGIDGEEQPMRKAQTLKKKSYYLWNTPYATTH